ncbi:Lrp/AsnC family transcriptional regulator [Pseudonocardia spinosispora]|uniref:Lrp/AsnC family transcriptional regulator n=1 Tax=Pseudonocardia spinosispora TaxID=103441 RepID=UPI00042258ED|nr:Lrp/AsnC family transcriptional regulator [Pseudonocardia spinosispora]
MERDSTVDAVDRRLLELLSADPRMSTRALARAIHMSASAVGERLDRLQKRGIIRGFVLDVDPTALGYTLEVVVAIQLRQGKPVVETVEALRSIPEVRNISLVTGSWDLLLTFLVRDQDHLRELLLGSVWSVADFQHSESMIILQTWSSARPHVGEEED